jgi:endoglucanase
MQRIYLAPVFISLSLLAGSIAVGLPACDVGEVAAGLGGGSSDVTGCTPDGGLPPTAPDGYYVSGNTVCTPAGKPHLLHGVDRPSMEWSVTGDTLSAADFQAMGSWHANVVRVALNQDFWLSGSPAYSTGYAPLVDQVVAWAHAAAMDVILDLHWSDCGNFTAKPGQQAMADQHSVEFWKEVATRYKGDGHVFFELYNEPNGIDAQTWLSGGTALCQTSPPSIGSYTVVGMQQLYDTVRATGANNLVIIGGVDYAYDLTVVQSGAVAGYNILYATHPYNNSPERQPGNWDTYWGYLTATNPVVVTEFGDVSSACTGAWDSELITYADSHNASWTAWGWYPGGCSFPSIISDWSYAPTVQGAVVKPALLGYDDPSTLPPAVYDAGSDAPTVGPDDAGDAATDGGPADAGSDGSDDEGAPDSGSDPDAG